MVISFLYSIIIFISFINLSWATNEGLNSPPEHSQFISLSENNVTTQISSEESTFKPGRSFWVAIQLTIPHGQHIYWKNPGDTGFPFSVQWELPEGFQVQTLHWPVPQRLELPDETIGFGYHDTITFLAEILPSKSITPNTDHALTAQLRWLSCSDTSCLPGNADLNLSITSTAATPQINPQSVQLFKEARQALPHKIHSHVAAIEEESIKILIDASQFDQLNLNEASFFPEDPSIIDNHQTPRLVKDPQSPHHYQLVLPLDTQAEEANIPTSLKGLLVLNSLQKENPFKKAFDLQLNFTNTSDNHSKEIAFNLPSTVIASDPIQNISEIEDESILNTNAANLFNEEPNIPMAILFAFLGGLLLNLMPCVLPVISLKILHFAKMSGQKRSVTLKHGSSFALGVLVSFWLLAIGLIILQMYGNSVGWGFQLQEPLFIAILAAIFALLGLNMLGVFEVGTLLSAWAGQKNQTQKSEGLTSSFFSGVLATAIATPCTGPFLGAALGVAALLSPIWSLSIFTSLGLGMAAPYLFLAAFPACLRFLPKPGNWMIVLKEAMGFLMLATTIWLVWVFSSQTNPNAVFLLLIACLILSIGAWILGKWGTPFASRWVRITTGMVVIGLFFLGGYLAVKAAHYQDNAPLVAYEPNLKHDQNNMSSNQWEPFSPQRLEELQKQGVPVLIDFTAKWCLICQTNHLVLNSKEVSQELEKRGVVKMLADWTKSDPVITEYLRKFGRNSVPLYLIYGKDPKQPPKVLPQVLTPDIVLKYLEQVGS